ncbi:MAG: NAD(P)H-hydrate dehydratase [Sphingomonas bacterium]|nr:NAD(P)H-hydrate dehydratase [Sphingomonas bacterium]MDB5689715.1 NAD(P)H-hydrate dehydratase [Sphingomonas bacterium]
MIPLDAAWLAAHPLPEHGDGTDKNSRGRVLAIGGSATVPGAIGLTAEAAFRAGAGKVRIATIADAAIPLGVRLPEAGTVALATSEGEIDASACDMLLREAERADCIVLGPGIGSRDRAASLGKGLLRNGREELTIVLDAASVACAGDQADLIRGHGGRVVMTPHYGEMASCVGCDEDAVAADPERSARDAADRFGAVIVLKSSRTVIAAPGEDAVIYAGGGVGLATGGSGDVLAGVIGGLLSRGAAPFVAACWGVWLHGEAGAALAGKVGRIGFLARELPAEIPGLMARR